MNNTLNHILLYILVDVKDVSYYIVQQQDVRTDDLDINNAAPLRCRIINRQVQHN